VTKHICFKFESKENVKNKSWMRCYLIFMAMESIKHKDNVFNSIIGGFAAEIMPAVIIKSSKIGLAGGVLLWHAPSII